MMEELYTIEEVSKNLKVSKMTLYRYIKSWKLKAFKLWKEIRIKKEDYEDFLQNSQFMTNS